MGFIRTMTFKERVQEVREVAVQIAEDRAVQAQGTMHSEGILLGA